MKKIFKYLLPISVICVVLVTFWLYLQTPKNNPEPAPDTVKMLEERFNPSVVKLEDGRVLVAGGTKGFDFLDTAEIFNPKTNKFRYTKGKLNIARSRHKSVLLDDGRVLIVGGNPKPSAFFQAEIFDPETEKFSLTGKLNEEKGNFTATKLQDGKILIYSSYSAEIYDPETEKFSLAGKSHYAHGNHTATLLNDGRVLITGGGVKSYSNDNGHHIDFSYEKAEIFDPETGEFTLTGDMNVKRREHKAILLKDGRVFIVGGYPKEAGKIIEVFDPQTGKFEIVEETKLQRKGHDLVLLPGGSVLIIGGDFEHEINTSNKFKRASLKIRNNGTCELFNPQNNQIKYIANCLTNDIGGHQAFTLKDNRIIAIGGHNPILLAKDDKTVELINLDKIKIIGDK